MCKRNFAFLSCITLEVSQNIKNLKEEKYHQRKEKDQHLQLDIAPLINYIHKLIGSYNGAISCGRPIVYPRGHELQYLCRKPMISGSSTTAVIL